MSTSIPIGDPEHGVYLKLPSQLDTMGDVLSDINHNTTKLSEMPLPYRFVSSRVDGGNFGGTVNGIMYNNGWAELDIYVNLGLSRPCNNPQANNRGFLSETFTVQYPFSFVQPPSCVSSKNVRPWTDVQLYNVQNSADHFEGWFWSLVDDSAANNVKEVSLHVAGWWRMNVLG